MDIQIIETPIRFRLYGMSSPVEDRRYGEVGVRLMNSLWEILADVKLETTHINHWVYSIDDDVFVGVELRNEEQATIPEQFELCEFELQRYSKHVHIGRYQELPQKWQALKAELAARGETVTMPSLEVYGPCAENADETKLQTTILMGLK